MRGKGFTLVELLVTISIMAILMTVALIAFDSVRKGSRDTKRKSDISSIQAALEQYHADQGYYPSGITFGSSLTNPPPVTKTYLSTIPAGTPPYSYTAKPNSCTTSCTNYCLYAKVENSSNNVLVDSTKCTAPPTGTYQYQTQAP